MAISNEEQNINNETDNSFEWLQDAVDQEMEKLYSAKAREFAKNPVNVGKIKNPEGEGIIKGLCGDTMQIHLKILKGVVKDAKFFCNGCGVLFACGSVVTQLSKEQTISVLLKVSPYQLIQELGGLPNDDVHCAILAVNTLHKAVADYLLRKYR